MVRRVLSSEVVRLTATSPPCLVDSTATHQKVAALALEFARHLPSAEVRLSSGSELNGVRSLVHLLLTAGKWTASDYAREAVRFAEAYPEAIEILPPDRYGDLVLLPALGCPNNRCSFCAFYRDRQFRILGDTEFSAHVDAVCQFMDAGAAARQGIFLGSASALSLSQRVLLSRLATINERFGSKRRGVGAFWDPDRSPERTHAEWHALQRLGLTTAYVGLETGLAELRAALGKSADLDRLLNKTQLAREAGVHLGVMVLAGVGELAQLDAHVERSAAVVAAMELSSKDLVFVSPLRGARPEAQLKAEAARLHSAISARTAAKVAPYAADRFHYYA